MTRNDRRDIQFRVRPGAGNDAGISAPSTRRPGSKLGLMGSSVPLSPVLADQRADFHVRLSRMMSHPGINDPVTGEQLVPPKYEGPAVARVLPGKKAGT